MGLPNDYFEGTASATFAVNALGAPNQEEMSSPDSLSSVEGDGSEVLILTPDMDVTFYHCDAGSFWDMTGAESSWSCEMCSDIDGDDEVMVNVLTD